MKILLIAGHGANDPGACSKYGTEATETRKVVNQLKSILGGYNVEVDVYNQSRNCYDDVKKGALQVNFADYDYVLEIHFNSSANASATGVEIFVTTTEKGITVEQAIVNKIANLGYPNRGVKREDFAVIRTAKSKGVSSALLEVCFISNYGDMNRYNTKFNEVCNAIVEGVATEFNLSKKSGYVPPTVTPTVPTPTPTVLYRVKTSGGKQLGAFSNLENAKNMAKSNLAIVYDVNNKVVISYVANKDYLNLKPHVSSWRVYKTNVSPVKGNECGFLAPKTFGGLSYEILAKPQADVYTIQTSSFGKVNIYAPRDNDSTITKYAVY